MYALLNLITHDRTRAMQDNGIQFFQADNVPFRDVQDAARTGFIRINDLPGLSLPASSRRVENNEYFFGSFLDLINQNVVGQGMAQGGHWRIKPSLAIDGQASHTY